MFDEKPNQLMIMTPAIALESVLKAYEARNLLEAHKCLTSRWLLQWEPFVPPPSPKKMTSFLDGP